MPTLLAARAQMGTSLVFHIIFSVLGVGLPLLLCIAEGLALRRKDPAMMTLAWYVACGFAGAAVYASSLLRGIGDDDRREGLLLGLAVGLIATPLQIGTEDFNALYLAHAKPIN